MLKYGNSSFSNNKKLFIFITAFGAVLCCLQNKQEELSKVSSMIYECHHEKCDENCSPLTSLTVEINNKKVVYNLNDP